MVFYGLFNSVIFACIKSAPLEIRLPSDFGSTLKLNTFRIMAKLCRFFQVALLAATFSLPAFAQQGKIEGQVLEERTNEPIAGAGVFLVNEKTGAVSDADGKFTIIAQSLPASFSVSYLGYKTAEVDVYEYTEPLTVYLREDWNLQNEVVVIGYGTQKRRELTSAISTVSKERLTQVTPSLETVLSGAVAGLNVSQTSGQPGAASTIRIRGGNSITGGNDPLYVIDGFIVYNDPTATRTGAGKGDAGLNPLASINTGDIESIEVLKDVSATAIYGSRGANGVIIITTRKGKKGVNNVNYQSTFGWQTIRKKLGFLNAREWAESYNEMRVDEGLTSGFIPESEIAKAGKGYDWQDAALQAGFTQDHQLSFNGGTEHSRYALSGGYADQDGIIRGTDYTRYSSRINLEQDLFSKFRIGVNASGSFSQQNGLVDRGAAEVPNTWVAAIRMPPLVPIYNADGGFNYDNPYVYPNAEGLTLNPISDLLSIKALTENTRVTGIFFAEYKILPELTAKVSVGTDLSVTKQSNYTPSFSSPGTVDKGIAAIGNKNVYAWQTEYTLNYSKVFDGVHSVSGLAGYTSQRTDRKAFAASSYGFSNDATTYNSLQSASTPYLPTSSAFTSTLISYLGRASYSYNERYNVTATLRADGSSRFARNHHWGYFPSLGVSWNIDKEPFFADGKTVSHLQLRLSGGTVGNQEIGDFRFIANIVPQTYYFGGQPVTAFIPENLSNPDLKWETTSQYNIGANVGFLENRLNVVLDAYYKKTSDLLLEVPVERVTGFKTVMRNIGSVSNKGVELEVEGKIIERKDLNWRAAVNIARNINRIESLGNADEFFPNFSGALTLNYVSPLIVRKGEPLGSFYGFVFDGIIQKGEDVSKLPIPAADTDRSPGKNKWIDQNGDGIVNEDDKVILGNSQPKFTGGFNSSVAYKRIDFFVALQGSYGNKLYNVLSNRAEKTFPYFNSLATAADRWTETNPSNELARAQNLPSIVLDNRYIEDASFLRVKNISIGYTFPLKSITKDAKLRLFLSAQNLFTLTPYKGYDPESNRNGIDESNGLYQGVDFGTYPSAKTFQFGVNVTL
ncbi:Outer membrane cobalamin receptor protein, SusC/RagA family [Bacteroidales bacterium Barb4]|nr:Outer membrane cobalamin receptor protein, SusC/RagA family [Bacteroidales bacterium Barb4]